MQESDKLEKILKKYDGLSAVLASKDISPAAKSILAALAFSLAGIGVVGYVEGPWYGYVCVVGMFVFSTFSIIWLERRVTEKSQQENST